MFFVFPQAWITPAIAAAALHFGPIDQQVQIKYRHLDGHLGFAVNPNKIVIDKLPRIEWPKAKAQCVLIHEYGHLAGYTDSSNKSDPSHSDNRNSIMYPVLRYRPCIRWLRRHNVG